jgi:predicted XRE-type DNA-binding protein
MSDSGLRNYYRKIIRSKGITGEECETLVHKVMLIAEIKAVIEANGWTQKQAADELGIKQPRIAELNRICVDKFSTDLLIKYLYRLNRIVDVAVVPYQKKSADGKTMLGGSGSTIRATAS